MNWFAFTPMPALTFQNIWQSINLQEKRCLVLV